ncbi:hypothetical protein G7046_g1987 [Stylonectria norvegica]|nr:hypothetical protein G7046_g1987 [Stylonectria norvegica]
MEANALDELSKLGFRDILDADSRPTFVIDLDPDEDSHSAPGLKVIHPVFCNAALRLHERLLDAVSRNDTTNFSNGEVDTTSYMAFSSWATGWTKQDDSKDIFPLSFLFKDLLWTGSTISKRWRLISGNRAWRADIPLRDLSSSALHDATVASSRREQTPESGSQDGRLEQPGATLKTSADPDSEATNAYTGTTSFAPPKKHQPLSASWHRHTSKGGSSKGTTISSNSASVVLSKPDKAVSDWTVPKPDGLLSPHLEFARSIEWGLTPLGPMDSWSPEFRQAANLCMSYPYPVTLFWGSELTMLYNLAYATEVAGNKHPAMMATGASGPFAEVWGSLAPVFAETARTGVSHRSENDIFCIDRHGFIEETYFSWSLTPLYGGSDRILGFFNAPFETTDQVLSQRRLRTINKLSDTVTNATSVKAFWKLVLESLEDNELDVPFALLYSIGEGEDGDYSSNSSGSTISLKACILEGTIGVPAGLAAAPEHLDLKRSREGFVPSFREAMRTREPTLLHTRDGTLPESLLEGIDWRGFGEPCRQAVIFPVRPTNGDAILAFLVMGVNPRKPYDEAYMTFANLLNRQLAASLASVILFEDETRRSRNAAESAALEKEELTQQLNLQASRLRRMTELSPLGMFLISPEGVLREANERFYEMTGHTRETQNEMSWTEFILPSSMGTMNEGWRLMVDELLPWSAELQLNKKSTSPVNMHGESIDYWVLFMSHPEFTSQGCLRSLMGSITDISHLKWAQGLQARRLQEAEETRRQQNEFIDITSHEMRNPLSAILQCADDISSSLDACVTSNVSPTHETIESCVESAHTIALCVQHQKSVVDDILTISKLDSNLLLINPVVCQPVAILRRVLTMFDPEIQAKDIDLALEVNTTYKDLTVDWVSIDPSRVLQILINLMTNAIKFTAASEKRAITIALGASTDPPDGKQTPDFQFVPPASEVGNVTGSKEWGTGEVLYVSFRVQDTGCGLTEDEKQLLFQRFKQASPRTHAQYGGSGLGLFISKRLSELHGGQIGVASTAGQGSHFGFFVKARRSSPPTEQVLPKVVLGEPTLSASTPLTQVQKTQSTPKSTTGLVTENVRTNLSVGDMNVLVVEDNIINQKILVNQLRKVGCTVNAANDGLEALEFLKKTRYCKADGLELSIILMDLEMPNMDGLACISEIRKMEREGNIQGRVPVIAVTANVRDEQMKTALQSGMDDLMSKPFRIPDLLKKIDILFQNLESTETTG